MRFPERLPHLERATQRPQLVSQTLAASLRSKGLVSDWDLKFAGALSWNWRPGTPGSSEPLDTEGRALSLESGSQADVRNRKKRKQRKARHKTLRRRPQL